MYQAARRTWADQYYKGVRQFYHTRYHATKINIGVVNKLRTVSRKLEVFLGEENMLARSKI